MCGVMVLGLGCRQPVAPPAAPVPPAVVVPPAAATASSGVAVPASPTPAVPPKGARVLHPIGGSMEGCLEMYSACGPDPEGKGQRCTSAPFNLNCGASGKVPGGTELLFCACP